MRKRPRRKARRGKKEREIRNGSILAEVFGVVVVHGLEGGPDAEFVWVHIDGSNTAAIYDQVVRQQGGFVFDTPRAEELKKRIYELIFACRNGQLPGETRLSGKLYGILTALLDSSRPDDPTDAGEHTAVRQARRLIETQYMQPLTLDDLARHVNMSQYHFSRQFKKDRGYPPHEYIILTRLNHAKHLLKTTDLPVKIIAQNVGYQNVSTFTSAFTSRVGVSPTQFRTYPI